MACFQPCSPRAGRALKPRKALISRALSLWRDLPELTPGKRGLTPFSVEDFVVEVFDDGVC
jgi:hypothetical protein